MGTSKLDTRRGMLSSRWTKRPNSPQSSPDRPPISERVLKPVPRTGESSSRRSGGEARRLLGSASGVASAVGMGSGPGEVAAIDDQVLLTDRSTRQPALQ